MTKLTLLVELIIKNLLNLPSFGVAGLTDALGSKFRTVKVIAVIFSKRHILTLYMFKIKSKYFDNDDHSCRQTNRIYLYHVETHLKELAL